MNPKISISHPPLVNTDLPAKPPIIFLHFTLVLIAVIFASPPAFVILTSNDTNGK